MSERRHDEGSREGVRQAISLVGLQPEVVAGMSNPRKRKGTNGENRGVRFLRRIGFTLAKRILQQSNHGMPDLSLYGADDLTFVVQVKAHGAPRIIPWHREALAQRAHVGAEYGALLWIPDNTREQDWVWVVDGKTMEHLLGALPR